MKLNQVLAVEKEIKTRVYGEVTALHKACQKSVLFNGFTKTYNRKTEESETYPPEAQRIQKRAQEAIFATSVMLTELFDIIATKDAANRQAVSDVVIDGSVLLAALPATTLLFLEKQLNDIRTFIEAMPVLDPAEHWEFDPSTGYFRTEPTQVQRTKKVARPIVLYPATPEHPAQTQLITEDIVAGYWEQVKVSSALTEPQKQVYLDRVNALSKAVKQAREDANLTQAPEIKIGEKVFKYLFS